MASTSIAWALNFKGHSRENEILEDASQVQPPPTASSVHVDPMDIVEAAPNRSSAYSTNSISRDTE